MKGWRRDAACCTSWGVTVAICRSGVVVVAAVVVVVGGGGGGGGAMIVIDLMLFSALI